MTRRDAIRRALRLAAGAGLLPAAHRVGQFLQRRAPAAPGDSPPFLYDAAEKTWWRFVAGQGYWPFRP